jgi:hypothetical protein
MGGEIDRVLISPSLFSESLPLPQTEIIPRKQLNFICRIEQIGESVNLKIRAVSSYRGGHISRRMLAGNFQK